MIKHLMRALSVLAAFLLAACGSSAPVDGDQEGRVLLWHRWSGADEETLNELLDNFNQVYPDITVISISHPPGDLRESFVDAATRGLGPDVMIGSQLWIPDLADAGLIRALDENDVNAKSYLVPALETLRYAEKLYGLPLAVETSALYYNRKLAEKAPESLEELLEYAVEGHKVAIATNFDSAFWGIQAFGGRVLDEDGRVVLNQGGLANWLDWLVEASNVPNIIQSKDAATLKDLFAQGEVAYYVGKSSELLELQDALGADAVGVSPLPAGPNNAAGPFLTTEPIFFSMDSSPAQTERARLLAEFLGNIEQQRRLAEQTGRVPANPQATINRRISPAVAGFVEQSKSANPLVLLPQMFDVIALGEETYLQALEGLVSPAEAANALSRAVNDIHGFRTIEVAPPELCHAGGDIEVWHAWPEAEAAALAAVGRQYADACPGVSVTLRFVDPDDIFGRYRQAVEDGRGPDLLLISSEYTRRLAAAELVSSISEQIEPEFLQRYIPNVPQALRFDGSLYGLPVTVDTSALYYNDAMVDAPPVDLGDLMNQISPTQQFALPYTPFRAGHWGLTAFGARLFDVDGSLAITNGGFGEWLNWLRAARDEPGMILTRSQDEARELFSRGEVAYFVGERRQLSALQAQMGEDVVRVVPLPAGPEGPSGPILDVQGFMLNPRSTVAVAAIEFAKHAASAESQAFLMREGNLAPAHANMVDPAAFPAISGFLDQARTAVVIDNRVETDAVFGLGDIIYERVLEDGADSTVVLKSFDAFIDQAPGASNGDTIADCDRAGQLVLWHSVEGIEATALEQIITDFGRRCPDVQVEALFVPAADLPAQLAAATSAGAPPDLFLSPHDLIKPLSAERLIKPITPWIEAANLIPYLSEAIDAMSHSGTLYGLPHSLDTSVLYYDADLVSEPQEQFFELVDSATAAAPLVLHTGFADAFWGATIFGGEVAAAGEDAQNAAVDVGRTTLVSWLSWLHAHKDDPAIVMNSDAGTLIEMFATGGAAYLIAGSDALPVLRAQPRDSAGEPVNIGVAQLPASATGQASPFLTVHGYLFSATATEEQTQLALEFAKFATSSASQVRLMQSASRAPANMLALTLVEDSALNAVVEQARASILLPSRPESLLFQEEGERLYQRVVQDGQPPDEAIADFNAFLREEGLLP